MCLCNAHTAHSARPLSVRVCEGNDTALVRAKPLTSQGKTPSYKLQAVGHWLMPAAQAAARRLALGWH